MEVEPRPILDGAAALKFLGLLYPEGPWLLTAISPDPKRGIATREFRPGQEKEILSWIADHDRRSWNIYYTVNELLASRAAVHKKAERTDVEAVRYLHVDVDPRAGGDLSPEAAVAWYAQEQARIETLLRSPPGGIPQPTALIASGGGVNALWRLRESIRIDGDIELAEQAKRYNIQLEIELGGDNCHNIDRILRLPGTVNYPNEVKQRRGRVVSRARLLFFEPDRVYDIAQFTAARAPRKGGAQADGAGVTFPAPRRAKAAVELPGQVQRLKSVDDLGDRVNDRTKMLIVQGVDPDDPTRWPSRSELLFHVCCELIRAGVDEAVIYSVITDPDFRISASVLDKSSPEKYALRQIDQARDAAIHPCLRQMNEKHAVIANLGNQCRVIQEVYDPALDRTRLADQSFADFRNRYLNVLIEVGQDAKGQPVRRTLGDWWLRHEHRRQYETITFSPGGDPPDAYNLWRGFAVEPRPGDRHQSYLTHVLENICQGNEAHYRYVLGWLARCVQQPDSPGEVALVLRGARGAGKSIFAKTFGGLFGRHFLQVTDSKHLVGSFNSHLRDCVVLFGDEAFYAGDKKHESVLKQLITEESLVIEGKGKDAVTGPNFTHLILAANAEWVVPAGPFERRYLMLDVGRRVMQDHAYFARLRHDLDSGGRENLLHFLQHYDLSGFEVRAVPSTDALVEQKLLSMSSEEEWWYRKLSDGQLLADHLEWSEPILKSRLVDDYLLYSQRVGTNRRSTETALGIFWRKVCPEGWPKSFQKLETSTDERGLKVRLRPVYVQFPSLEECRARWDAVYGISVWREIDIREAPEPSEVF